MKLESIGILISLRPFDERNAVAKIFSRDFGVLSGVLRGANSVKTNRPLVGQVGAVTWGARLDSQLGVFHWDAEKNLAAVLMSDMDKLSLMNAMFDLIGALLPEREPYLNLYDKTLDFFNALRNTDAPWQEYMDWEIVLLAEMGYALDLSKCSGCGKTENLKYISPKTGRAVCADCGAPYAQRLFKMPINLNTTFRFLENVCAQQDVKMPKFRQMLVDKKI